MNGLVNWRRFYFTKYHIVHILRILFSKNLRNIVFVFNKNYCITEFFFNSIFYIYTGKFYRRLVISKYFNGFNLGSFCLTRKPFNISNKKVIKTTTSRR